jgi:hypothetical protein
VGIFRARISASWTSGGLLWARQWRAGNFLTTWATLLLKDSAPRSWVRIKTAFCYLHTHTHTHTHIRIVKFVCIYAVQQTWDQEKWMLMTVWSSVIRAVFWPRAGKLLSFLCVSVMLTVTSPNDYHHSSFLTTSYARHVTRQEIPVSRAKLDLRAEYAANKGPTIRNAV